MRFIEWLRRVDEFTPRADEAGAGRNQAREDARAVLSWCSGACVDGIRGSHHKRKSSRLPGHQPGMPSTGSGVNGLAASALRRAAAPASQASAAGMPIQRRMGRARHAPSGPCAARPASPAGRGRRPAAAPRATAAAGPRTGGASRAPAARPTAAAGASSSAPFSSNTVIASRTGPRRAADAVRARSRAACSAFSARLAARKAQPAPGR